MRMFRWILRAIPISLGVLVLTAVAVLSLGRIERTVEADGEVKVRNFQMIRPEISGIVSEVLAEPGSRVVEGQVVVQLRDSELRRTLISIRQQLEESEANLEKLRREREILHGRIHPLELEKKRREQRRSKLEAAAGETRSQEQQLQLEGAKDRLRRSEELHAAGLLSEQEIKEIRLEVLEAEQRSMRLQLESELDHDRSSEIAESLELLTREQQLALERSLADELRFERQIAGLSAQLGQLEEQVESHKLRATMDGILVSSPVNELLGRRVQAGEDLSTVIDAESIYFVTEVPEQAIVRVRSGQTAQIELAGLPKRRFDIFWGEVQKVSQEPALNVVGDAGEILYPVEIHLEDPWVHFSDGRFFLRSGMRGTAEIAYRHNVPLFEVLFEVVVGERGGLFRGGVERSQQPKPDQSASLGQSPAADAL